MRLDFHYDPVSGYAGCRVRLNPKYQGATGYAHGGMIATLLDEAMAKANGLAGIRAVTLRITVSYKKMVPIDEQLRLMGWRTSKKGRKIYLKSELRDNEGELLASARGLFLTVKS